MSTVCKVLCEVLCAKEEKMEHKLGRPYDPEEDGVITVTPRMIYKHYGLISKDDPKLSAYFEKIKGSHDVEERHNIMRYYAAKRVIEILCERSG